MNLSFKNFKNIDDIPEDLLPTIVSEACFNSIKGTKVHKAITKRYDDYVNKFRARINPQIDVETAGLGVPTFRQTREFEDRLNELDTRMQQLDPQIVARQRDRIMEQIGNETTEQLMNQMETTINALNRNIEDDNDL